MHDDDSPDGAVNQRRSIAARGRSSSPSGEAGNFFRDPLKRDIHAFTGTDGPVNLTDRTVAERSERFIVERPVSPTFEDDTLRQARIYKYK